MSVEVNVSLLRCLWLINSFAYFQLAIALWNGEDSILKERIFGLTGSEGNHQEDVKLIQQLGEHEAQHQ